MDLIGAHGESANHLEHQEAISARVSYSLLQERADASLRERWGATDRHDIFVCGPDGQVKVVIPGVKNAHTSAGYAALKQAIVAALAQ